MLYPILKSAHLLFVMAWVAAVFYLPRLLINFAEAPGQHDVQARLLIMARRLYLFGHVMFGLSLLCGIGLIHFSGAGGWLHAKLTLVGGLVVYHIACRQLLQVFLADGNTRSHTWFRVFNELPVLLLLAIVILVIVKPF